ncbi:NADp-dependent alcohol dehydrogenase protein [Rutstroemia sp. NJR-2017a WRK4]|nr:NADp-dependent alcohol dehydrogenase protein [Rutstroemia sp. NJR-2017a WRK4]
MASILPPFPKFVFTVFEPISLVAGFIAPFISPEWFIAEQVASSPLEAVSDNARLVAYQLGNIYLLLAMVGIGVLYSTSEAKVVRNYLIALWIADIGHVAVTYNVLGWQRSIDITTWNSMTWGNIGATVRYGDSLHSHLVAYTKP